MNKVTTIKEAREQITAWKKQGLTIGLVPTMGFLHQGHISLIEKAKTQNDKVIVSIFVNPIQFGPNEDFEKYPRDLERDLKLCENAGATMVFAPEVMEMYPYKNLVYIDVELLGDNLCGAVRQGHFRGVCTVVAKLFQILTPDKAYFGQKDAQQLAIIERMTKDLNFNIDIIPCPIVREPDGLAMSSRNAYLTPEQRQSALVLSKSLQTAKELLAKGERNADIIRQAMITEIEKQKDARLDYVEIVDGGDLSIVHYIENPVLIALAVFIGKVRLIDNYFFKEKAE